MSPDSAFGISDPFSSLSHFLGALSCLALAAPLARRAQPPKRAYLWIFSLSAVFLLTMSGLFHLLPRGSASRDFAQRLDHAAIFTLIAGTFTAGHGLFFRGFWRSGMIVIVWTLGIAGLAVKVVLFEVISEGVGLALYLTMGWLGALAMVKLALNRDFHPALQLFVGGVVYTAGALAEFAGGESWALIPGVIGPHELFHVAVLGGLGIHWRLFHDAAATWQAQPLSARP